jgi:hypothetical protein
VLPAHSPRQLVERVDVVCGAAPPATSVRRLLTPAGAFELRAGRWEALWLTDGGAELVAAAPGLGIHLSGAEPIVNAPEADALAAVQRADPHGVRLVEFSSGAEAAERFQSAAQREATL